MNRKSVRKVSQDRSANAFPSEGGRPSRKTNADIGSVTRGSAGRPKASRAGAPKGRTKAYQTTSTSFPKEPVPKSFLNKLGEMYTAEKELTYALPLIVKSAKSKDLKALLRIHLKETKNHAKTLERVAKSLGEKLPSKSCKTMTQLIKEGVKVVAKRLLSSDQDAALIGVGQKIEQFEIRAYSPLCAEAERMDWTHELALLTSILNQEKLANDLLGGLAAGKGPLKELLAKTSLKHAGASMPRVRAA